VGYTRHTTLVELNIITPGEDCALPVELAGQLEQHQPHYIAAADKEHSSSSHKGRQKAFQDKHRNGDACSAEGLPKGRWEGGNSEMSTGNGPFFIHPKQKTMTLEPTWETQKCNSENFSGTSCFRLVPYSSGF
jgi:hypothetical protein